MRFPFPALLLFALLLVPSGLRADDAVSRYIRLTSPGMDRASIYVRPSGSRSYIKVAESAFPVTVEIKADYGGNCDIMIERYRYFFIRERGEKQEQALCRSKAEAEGDSLTINTQGDIAWERAALAVLVVLLVGVEQGRRRKAKAAMALEESLRATETRAMEAEERERTSSENLIPERIGNYRVLEKLGEGGMASVYRVEDEYGDCYALKEPHLKILKDEESLRRFTHELKIGMTLNHPHIVRIYDSNLDCGGEHPSICMEYVKGRSLSDIIKNEAPLESSRALALMMELTEALVYAHGKNVVHRDIKPGNIMVTEKGLKIMDFGIAKARGLSTVTKADTMLGTPSYMAPEQIDSHDVDHRADLYALGIIFYELMTGRIPYDDDDPVKIVMKKLTTPAPGPSLHNPSLSAFTEHIIMKLIRREREDRYQSAQELLEDLKKASDDTI